MFNGRPDFSPRGRARVFLLTSIGTLVCIAVAFAFDSYSFEEGWRWGGNPINNVIIPLVLAPPLFFVLLSKLRELAIAHQELLLISATDSLTSCFNRRAFTALVDGYLEKLEGREREGALLVIDVDHFKSVNDTYGHEIGDLALRNFSQILLSELGPSDVLARWGGEEFILYLCERDQENARAVLEEARKAIAEAEIIPQQQITFSAGIVAMSGDIDTDAASADALLYAAKKAGRNRIAIPRDTIEQRPDELLDYAPKTRRARSSTKTT